MRIEITKQDHVLVFEVAEESGIATFDKIRKVFNIITMNGESFPSGIDFFRERLEQKDADVKQPPQEPQRPAYVGQSPFTPVKDLIDRVKREAMSYAGGSTHEKINLLIDIVEKLDNEMPRIFSTPSPYIAPMPFVPNWGPNTQPILMGDPLPPGGTTTCEATGSTAKDSNKFFMSNRTAMCQADGMGDDSGTRGD
jgi:hypothetical protein